MPSIGGAGRARAGTGRSTLILILAATVLAIPATAAAAPVGSAAVHSKRASKRAGSAVAYRAVASVSTSVHRLNVYLDASSTAARIELGLYRGSSKPRAKVGGCMLSAPKAGWNSCTLASVVRVTRGRTYWMALLLPRGAHGVIRFRDKRSRGARSYISSSTSLRSLPASYRPGGRWHSARSSMYADRGASPAGAAAAADGDKDGVPDASDRCPAQAGPASNGGCPAAAPAPSRSSNCMPDPSACGFPDVETTGVPPGTPLTPASGLVTLSTAGQVYENKVLTGGIVVTAPNVTIRNVKVIKQGVYQAIHARRQEGDTSGLRIEDVEIDMQGDEGGYGIIEDGFTAVRTYIHDGSDCGHLGTNSTIRDSFCSVGPDANNDGWADSSGFCSGSEHFDGYSTDGGANQVYDHNTIRNPCSQTSAILISTNSGAVNNVTITNNLMAGGGWTLYCAATTPGVGGNETVTGNRFARTYNQKGGGYGPAAYCNDVDQWSGNVWDDTGQAIGR
jgi:hypothetical protein